MSQDGAAKTRTSAWVQSLLSGAVAGVCTDISLFPLDTIKTRLQSSQGFFAAGGFSNVYRGIGSAALGSAPSAALFFVTYDATKRRLLEYARLPGQAERTTMTGGTVTARKHVDPTTSALVHMVAGSLGEIAGCLVRVPVEVVKQRTQAVQHPTSLAAFLHVYRSHRGFQFVREIYRGGAVTLLRELPFTIIQFPLWEALKAWHMSRFHPPIQSTAQSDLASRLPPARPTDVISPIYSALYGSLSAALAAGVTTPLDVLKTRLMLSNKRVSAIAMLIQIYRLSGPRALFAGAGPRIIWISAGGAIFLGSYQLACNQFDPEPSYNQL